MKIYKLLVLSVIATASLASVHAANLIPNGDFSSGYSGFTSDYTQVTVTSPTSLYPEGTYTVANNPVDGHNLWQSIPSGNPYNSTNGDMLIVNGAKVADQVVWATASPINIVVGESYFFQSYVTNLYPPNATALGPAILDFEYSYDNLSWNSLTSFNLANTISGVWQLGGDSFIRHRFASQSPFDQSTDGS